MYGLLYIVLEYSVYMLQRELIYFLDSGKLNLKRETVD